MSFLGFFYWLFENEYFFVGNMYLGSYWPGLGVVEGVLNSRIPLMVTP